MSGIMDVIFKLVGMGVVGFIILGMAMGVIMRWWDE